MAGTACILDIIGPPAQSCVSCRTGSGAFNNLLGYSSVFGSADGTQSMQDEYSTIVQGSNNQVLAYGQACHGFNAIVNGCQMTIEGWNDFIGTGDCSCIIDWQPGASNAKGHNGIVQGYHTCILCSYVSGVAFGAFHDMECNYTGAILGGDHNCIRPDFAGGGTGFVYRSNIVGGVNNVICGAHCATIGGGSSNHILGNGSYGFIGSGDQNVINANAPQSFIGTGQGNTINSNSSFSLCPRWVSFFRDPLVCR